MKITLTVGTEKKDIELLPISGRAAQQGWQKGLALEKSTEETQKQALDEYLAWRDRQACALTGLSPDELLDLNVDDRSKVFGFLQEQLQKDLGFTKPS